MLGAAAGSERKVSREDPASIAEPQVPADALVNNTNGTWISSFAHLGKIGIYPAS
jgi:hypothetical protein